MKYLLLTILLLSGCAGIEWNTVVLPEGAITVGPRETVIVNSITDKTDGGTHIEKFYCTTGMMVCEQHAGKKYCSCQREIILPSTMRF